MQSARDRLHAIRPARRRAGLAPLMTAAPLIWAAVHSPGPFVVALHEHARAALLITLLFAFLAYRIRGVDYSGALAGAVLSFLLFVSGGPGAFVVVLAVFVLTVASTRFGYTRKRQLGVAERKQGRNGWQILANLAVAAAFCVGALYGPHEPLLLAGVAALAEAAADTVSGECGKALSDQVFLITTFKRVTVGTDGGISLAGTVAGVIAALIVALVSGWTHLVSSHRIAVVGGAAVLASFVDSLLGATLQRRGFLNNEAVNLVSTAAASGIALVLLR